MGEGSDGQPRDPGEAWVGRPWLSRGVRAAVAVVPLLASVAATTIATRLIHRPTSGWLLALWWVGLLFAGGAVLWLVDRFARRLLPLSVLLRLTLVFPDRAPSRMSVALRSGSTKSLTRIALQPPHGRDEVELAHAAEEILALLAALNAHDRRTRGHSDRVRAYTKLLADELPLSDDERNRLQWAAMLHDIGKLTVPAEILNKNGRPDESEWAILQGHPGAANSYLEPLRDWLGEWIHAADQHHERWDGTGYPLGLEADEISQAGRIVAVADAFEVMTAVRSYKRPMSATDARAELARCSGTHFDPAIVRCFLNVSLGDLRAVMGPLSLLAQIPVLGGLRDATQTISNIASPIARVASAGAVAGASIVTFGHLSAAAAPTSIRRVAALTVGSTLGTTTTPTPTTAPKPKRGTPASKTTSSTTTPTDSHGKAQVPTVPARSTDTPTSADPTPGSGPPPTTPGTPTTLKPPATRPRRPRRRLHRRQQRTARPSRSPTAPPRRRRRSSRSRYSPTITTSTATSTRSASTSSAARRGLARRWVPSRSSTAAAATRSSTRALIPKAHSASPTPCAIPTTLAPAQESPSP